MACYQRWQVCTCCSEMEEEVEAERAWCHGKKVRRVEVQPCTEGVTGD